MRFPLLVYLAFCLSAFAACAPIIVETEPPYPVEYEYFRIPPGHLPPPGGMSDLVSRPPSWSSATAWGLLGPPMGGSTRCLADLWTSQSS